jgi:hypothetical protein
MKPRQALLAAVLAAIAFLTVLCIGPGRNAPAWLCLFVFGLFAVYAGMPKSQ